MFTLIDSHINLAGFACVSVNFGILPPDINGNLKIAFVNRSESLNFFAFKEIFPEHQVKFVNFNGEVNKKFDMLIIEIPLSHMSCDEREKLNRVISNCLRENGLLFLKYDSRPGSTPKEDFIKFVNTFVKNRNPEGVKKDLELVIARPSYFLGKHNDLRQYVMEQIKRDRKDVLENEFLNENYKALLFSEVYENLRDLGLTFAGRAQLEMNDPEIVLFPSQISTLAKCGTEKVCKELTLDIVLNISHRKDVYVKSPKIEEEKAIDAISEKLFLIPRQNPDKLRREIQLPGGHKLSLMDPLYDYFFINSEEPRRLTDHPLYAKNKKTVWKAFYRVLSTGEFILGIKEEVESLNGIYKELPEKFSLTPPNDKIIKKSFELLENTYIVSSVTGGPAVSLNVIEVIFMYFALQLGKEKAINETISFLKNTDKFIKIGNSLLRGKDLKEDNVMKTLHSITRGRKAFNLQRLKIVRGD